MKRRNKIILYSILSFFLLCAVTFFIYTSFYYRATDEAMEYLISTEEVTVLDDKNIIFKPNNEIKGGIIFYPGAKVEHKAYSKLMHLLAEEGYLCVLVKMPFKLAFFGMNKADEIIDEYDYINEWHMMGHSLGGAFASRYASKKVDRIKSVILLASYSTSDISGLDVLSIYGSNDQILNMEKYENNKKFLPNDYIEVKIAGGNHAAFGIYGAQKGDGKLEIKESEQIFYTIFTIISFLEP